MKVAACSYYSFVFGGLRHFDLPDMIAALEPGQRALVLQPLDALREPLQANVSDATFGPSTPSVLGS